MAHNMGALAVAPAKSNMCEWMKRASGVEFAATNAVKTMKSCCRKENVKYFVSKEVTGDTRIWNPFMMAVPGSYRSTVLFFPSHRYRRLVLCRKRAYGLHCDSKVSCVSGRRMTSGLADVVPQ